MTTRYVGAGGSDAANGLTWATRKLTLNGVEDSPVAAGDTVYVGPGTYRESLTIDVAGGAGTPIVYIGDYTGANTDGVGGVVRITGSDTDQTAARTSCITAASTRSNRTFRNFLLNYTSGNIVVLSASSSNWIFEQCYFETGAGTCIVINGTGTGHIIRRCFFFGRGNGIQIIHTATVDNTNQLIENCIFLIGGSASGQAVRVDRVGGVVCKNCTVLASASAFRVNTALTVGQTFTVNNCLILNSNVGCQSTTATELAENFNTFYGNATDRSTTNAGANSVTYDPLLDSRWFFQLVNAGAGPNSVTQLITPFDLASYSQLANLAGTSPPTADIRGTTIQGAAREWGPFELDTTLKIAGSAAGGGGPLIGGRLVGPKQ